ncbi:unnamed protein product [Ranitomeya imitator]|uniref:Uncharacterized protein n=1 Tax=Ranitomeya imitator TaxID=111125 RepID=A0ABN9LPN8_9NEOB|nr:unnamed protein product [Ranitomeya imitator]
MAARFLRDKMTFSAYTATSICGGKTTVWAHVWDNHQFPAKPLRESQSHLLTNTESWTESSCNEEKGKVGMSNPALTIEKET